MKKEFVIGVTGASGARYARRLLEVLCREAEVHIIVSDVAQQIASHEGVSFEGFDATYHAIDKIAAPIASGSHRFDGMVVIPCSAGTLGRIASGVSESLVSRAADVCLKERRPLVLCLRETPLNRIHLENMLRVHDAGAVVMPIMPGYYFKPAGLEDLYQAFATRVMDQLGLPEEDARRWGG